LTIKPGYNSIEDGGGKEGRREGGEERTAQDVRTKGEQVSRRGKRSGSTS